MRWAGWILVMAGLVACGGGAGGGAGPGGGGVTPPGTDAGPEGGSDGGISTDCAGIVPDSPGSGYAFEVRTNAATDSCDLATSDGQGFIAARSGTVDWREFSAIGLGTGGSFQAPSALVPQSRGFVGLASDGNGGLVVESWDENGNLRFVSMGGSSGMVALAPVQGDGAVAFSADAAGLKVRALDGTLNETAAAIVPGTFTPRGGARDASGPVLALVGSGSTVSGIWIDLAKGTAGTPFPVGTATAVLARPLLGGGVVVRLDGHWSGLVQPGDSTLRAPPAWLLDGTDFVPARAGKAYALVPVSGSAIDLVSAQGNRCGAVTFAAATSVSLGLDGSVIGGSGPRGCSKIFWRGVLR